MKPDSTLSSIFIRGAYIDWQGLNKTAEINYEAFKFSVGEIQVQIGFQPRAFSKLWLSGVIKSSDDIMLLFMLTDALRRACGDVPMHLELPYVPYGRQDRVCAPGEALSLKVFTTLLNAQKYTTVTVVDPHSDVQVALIDRCEVISSLDAVIESLNSINDLWANISLVAPDAGALKKIQKLSMDLGIPFVRADKARDPTNGAITGTVVYAEPNQHRDFLIVDDICDGGRTFIELAKALRALTTGKVYLYISHGIFSQGFEELEKHLDGIFVNNSFRADLPAFIKEVC